MMTDPTARNVTKNLITGH